MPGWGVLRRQALEPVEPGGLLVLPAGAGVAAVGRKKKLHWAAGGTEPGGATAVRGPGDGQQAFHSRRSPTAVADHAAVVEPCRPSLQRNEETSGRSPGKAGARPAALAVLAVL